jgi:hypothetical protein
MVRLAFVTPVPTAPAGSAGGCGPARSQGRPLDGREVTLIVADEERHSAFASQLVRNLRSIVSLINDGGKPSEQRHLAPSPNGVTSATADARAIMWFIPSETVRSKAQKVDRSSAGWSFSNVTSAHSLIRAAFCDRSFQGPGPARSWRAGGQIRWAWCRNHRIRQRAPSPDRRPSRARSAR